MKRREFLKAGSAVAGATTAFGAAAGSAAAQEGGGGSGGGNETGGNKTGGNQSGGGASGGGGGTKTVEVGPGGEYVFSPGTNEPLYVKPGTTVQWVWKSNNHNIVVDTKPSGSDWKGHQPLENSGYTYEFTFDTKGDYHYYCQPHQSLGMVADLVVNDTGQAPGGGGGGGGEVEPEEMGVPIQAHYVGIATILAIIVSLIFSFFQLKYGESPHTKGGN